MKKILIAGSSKNLGKFIREGLTRDYKIISLSRSSHNKAQENNFKCDLANEKMTKNTLTKIKKKYKNLDAIIFSVGCSKKDNQNLKNLYKKFDTNFVTFFNILENYCSIYKYKPIKIIVISSIVAEKVLVDAPIDYAISKAALNTYIKYKAKLLAKFKIIINIISPGNILIQGNNWDKRLKKNKKLTKKYIFQNVPLNKFISGKTILQACKFLIENDKDITGSNIILDGGQNL